VRGEATGSALWHSEATLTHYWKNGSEANYRGAYSETKEQLGGILLLEARNMNES